MVNIEYTPPTDEAIIEELKKAEDKILWQKQTGDIYAKLSFIILVYFENDNSPEKKLKTINLLERFKARYPMKAHFKKGSRGFVKLTDKSFESTKAKFLAFENYREAIEWHLTSNTSGEFAEDYFIGTLADHFFSYLKIHLPVSLLYDAEGRAEIQEWVEDVLGTYDGELFHGYAGLSTRLPYDRHPYAYYEADVAREYWGITADGSAFSASDWYRGIRSISWLSFIGQPFVDKVLEQPYYAQTLKAYPQVEVKRVGQTMVIQAGSLPRVANKHQPLPLAYVVAAHLTRPIQTPHTQYGSGALQWINAYYWLRRWDNDNFEQGVLNPNGNKPNLVPIFGQALDYHPYHIVPHSGMWQPVDFVFGEGEWQSMYLQQGMPFPEEGMYLENGKKRLRRAVKWRLMSREDGGAIVMPNPL
ncbi:type VI immunity family protein [Moraxella bovis]|uniref:Protein of uncharacterized function (DUF3396) n=1 Tax=Moraxella bovis TaxID=476 RepID=A0A378PR06_MORBO|nr:type VI immunity family protein [Moraxella bovis]STY90977.1 Protein of uncharacterised function (DUF3396) [Moraxella bovis]